MTRVVRGVDVGSQTLDARIGQDEAWQQFSASPEGLAALAAFCRQHAAGLVAMEAVGGHERQAFGLL